MPKHSIPRPRSHSLASYLQERLSIKRTFGLYQPFGRLQAHTMDLADSTEVFLDRFTSGVTIDTASENKKKVASAKARQASARELLTEGKDNQ